MLGGNRVDRVSELIRQEISGLIARNVEFEPGVLVTVTRVACSPDFEHAKVWVSVLPADRIEAVLETLGRNIRELQRLLNRALVMNPLPRIRFLIDRTEQQAEGVERLLDSLGE